MADNEKILNCPACGTEMKKIPLENYGFCIDICLDGCGSIVFDNREFQKFDEKTENIDPILAAYEGKEFSQTDCEKELRCPICNSKMVKNNAGPACECKIDECYVCGTRFLNYDELLKIREKAGENSPEYESALKIIIAENNRLKDQHERSDSMYKKIQNAGDTFFKKH